ncbi:hypothetical protein [Sinosporangium siamense]|uniref:Uncharacterized protein n=1 Tax=Sinosporangium siamense TaxID=1367973 RepID=A0A919V5Z9_9ACTN|nr:hypothetical protein [Sinosporangium siamense]GII90467.1 hypothetical protein Ssi02_06980 [Sinosporangium siamense]
MKNATGLIGSGMAAALVGGVVLITATVAPAAASSPTLGPSGYGVVKLGMSAKQATATGAIVRNRNGEGGCTTWDLKADPNKLDGADLLISPKRGVAVIFSPKGAKTPQGIRLGSTAKQLYAAYPKFKKTVHGYLLAAVPGNSKAYYSFAVERGKVTEMSLALKNQDCVDA